MITDMSHKPIILHKHHMFTSDKYAVRFTWR